MSQLIAVLDFGSQYTQVIARRIRECQVYSKIFRYDVAPDELLRENVCGIILSGGPSSVLLENAPLPNKRIFDLNLPILGICYGLQLQGYMLGGEVAKGNAREYGKGHLKILADSLLLQNVDHGSQVWNSHGDKLIQLPPGYEVIASTENAHYAVIENKAKHFYGLQFHPEVTHSHQGMAMIQNFLYDICGCKGDWVMEDFIQHAVNSIRKEVGDQRVILGLSGGVDSSVAAALIHKAIGDQLVCVFVENGLLRLKEREEVERLFKGHFQIDLRIARAEDRFLKGLRGVEDPEEKRKIIGRIFVEVFEDIVQEIGGASFLAQGTLYPDVIESISIDGNPASLIKSHHNVGGLPEKMHLKLLEPLRELFKDEVRQLGEALGLPKNLLWRHPFPGPSLAIRMIGPVEEEKLPILRLSDSILYEEMIRSDYYDKVWQSFCVFLPIRTVGVMGDERTYDYVIALRIVESTDGMTADWAELPHGLLKKISNRIINEVQGVNRVVLDISSKPPATIEWE